MKTNFARLGPFSQQAQLFWVHCSRKLFSPKNSNLFLDLPNPRLKSFLKSVEYLKMQFILTMNALKWEYVLIVEL